MGHPYPQFTYGLSAIIRRLGQTYGRKGAERSERWQIDYVTALIDGSGFPPPLPLMRGGRLCVTVQAGSQWPVAAVEAWFEQFMPPDGDPTEAIRERAAANDMDSAAFAPIPDARRRGAPRPALRLAEYAA